MSPANAAHAVPSVPSVPSVAEDRPQPPAEGALPPGWDEADRLSILDGMRRWGKTWDEMVEMHARYRPKPVKPATLAKLLLESALDEEEYRVAREEVRSLGLDADAIPHEKAWL